MKRLRLVAITGAAVVAALALPAAALASTGPALSSPGQAGMAVTGARFRAVSADVYLRNGGQYASEVAGVGGSVSLWASDGELVLLGISTDTGGPNHPYSPGVTVYSGSPYNASTVVATQNDASVNGQTCPHGGVCTPGDSANWPDHQTVKLAWSYNRTTGTVSFQETTAAGDVYRGHYHIGVGLSFSKAEVTSDFGTYAGTHDGYLAAPASTTAYLTWRGVSLTSYGGHTASLVSWWARHHVVLAGAPGGAKAGSVSGSGTQFTTFLTP